MSLKTLIEGMKANDSHRQFLKATTEKEISDDLGTRARTYLVGTEVRAWITHAGEDWGSVNKQSRTEFQGDSKRELVHVFIRHSESDFEAHVEDNAPEMATQTLDWYAVPDNELDAITSDGRTQRYINKRDFDALDPFYHDSSGYLEAE